MFILYRGRIYHPVLYGKPEPGQQFVSMTFGCPSIKRVISEDDPDRKQTVLIVEDTGKDQ